MRKGVIGWLVKLLEFLEWLGVVKVIPSEHNQSSQPPQPGDYRPVCPTCKAIMEFTWAETDIHGYKEEVGYWLCKCTKISLTSSTVSASVIGDTTSDPTTNSPPYWEVKCR